MKIKKREILSLLSCFLLIYSNGHAASVSVKIKATINASTCTVNNGQEINVDFKDIPASDISNAKYQYTIDVPVKCDFNTGVPYVKVLANTLGSDGNVVATSTPNFGIALYQGTNLNSKLMIGEGTVKGDRYVGYRVLWGLVGMGTPDGILTFTAVPYKLGNSDPAAGPFSASATLSFNYI